MYDDSDASKSDDDSDSDGEQTNDHKASDYDSDAELKVCFNNNSISIIIGTVFTNRMYSKFSRDQFTDAKCRLKTSRLKSNRI